MAEKAVSSFAAAQKLEDQLTCPICLDQYNDPRTLQCLHSFCIKCLEGLPLHGEHSLSCPTCRTVIDIPEQGVTSLPKAFNLNNLIEVFSLMKKASDVKGDCGSCKQNKTIAIYCPECDKFICNFCNDIHTKWGPTSTHKVMSIDEVSDKASKMISVKPVPEANCPSHNKPLDLYCVTCEQPICYLCTIKDHKGHTHDLISDAYDERKTEIQSSLQFVEKKLKDANKKKEKMLRAQVDLKQQVDFVKSTINKHFDKFSKDLEKARAIRLHSMDNAVENVKSIGSMQIKQLETSMQALKDCEDHAKFYLEVSTPTQLLLTRKQLLSRMEALVKSEECCDAELIPLEKMVNIEAKQESFTEIESAFKILKSRVVIPFHFPEQFYKHCEVSSLHPTTAIAKKKSTATFFILLDGKLSFIGDDKISGSFENEHDSIKCHEVHYLFTNEEMRYQVSFTPKVAGTYNLKLKIDGMEFVCKTAQLKVRYQ